MLVLVRLWRKFDRVQRLLADWGAAAQSAALLKGRELVHFDFFLGQSELEFRWFCWGFRGFLVLRQLIRVYQVYQLMVVDCWAGMGWFWRPWRRGYREIWARWGIWHSFVT